MNQQDRRPSAAVGGGGETDAMSSATVSDFDLIAELREAYRVQSKDAAYLMFDEQGEESERVQLRANLMYLAADTLAAERDRADRAEARLAEARKQIADIEANA
jgi:hypothetical protein